MKITRNSQEIILIFTWGLTILGRTTFYGKKFYGPPEVRESVLGVP